MGIQITVHARAVVAASDGDVSTLTRIADAVCESLQFQINQCSSQSVVHDTTSAPQPQLAELYATVNELSKKFDRMMASQNNKGRGRSRSRSRNRKDRSQTPANQDECWYHRKYGSESKKCRSPCKHNGATADSSNKN